jgi:glycyl-tRNA synthetase (class II)
MVAVFLTETLKSLKRDGVQVDKISENQMREIFRNIGSGELMKESASDVVAWLAKNEDRSIRDAIRSLGLKTVSEDELKAVVERVVEENGQLIKERGESSLGVLMGTIMKSLRGKADAAQVSKMLKEKRLGDWHAYWLAEQLLWFKKLGLEKIKVREHMKSELSHYSSATFDMDYEYPFGSLEIAGNANRGQYDLSQHQKFSGEKMEIFDDKTKERVVPRVIEPTFGIDRVFLALLCQAYTYDEKRENVVLKLPAKFAPIKAAIFPLVNDEKMIKISRQVFADLKKEFNVSYDSSGSVGRRYSRNDEIGTPFCITIDADSIKGKDVTIRDRDDTKQIRVKISDLREKLRKLIFGEIEFEKAGKIVETRVKEV